MVVAPVNAKANPVFYLPPEAVTNNTDHPSGY
jgi:hypothetical protein